MSGEDKPQSSVKAEISSTEKFKVVVVVFDVGSLRGEMEEEDWILCRGLLGGVLKRHVSSKVPSGQLKEKDLSGQC